MSELHSALQNETGLGHRTFCGVNEKNNAVYHFKDTFDFTAKVSVTGGVDDVYLNTVANDRCVFRKYGDSSFSFEVAGVHNSLSYDLIFVVCVTLLEHLVNKRGFAVVNVSYNCDITKVFSYQNNYLSIIFLWQKIILSYKILFIFVNLVIISCFIAKIKI